MSTNSKLVVRESAGLGMTGTVQINSMSEVFRLAQALSEASGFVPSNYVGKPNAIAAAILTGIELGMGPMESLREIHIVQGRPTLSAACMLGRALRAGIAVEWIESSDNAARLRLTRNGVSYEQAWALDDAKRAGLLQKSGPWLQYPAAMLRARCISAAVRAFCPDVIGGGGLYTPEEVRDIEPSPRPVLMEPTPAPIPIPAKTVSEVRPLDEESKRMREPERFSDCHDADELQSFGTKRRAAFMKLANGRRQDAQRACDEAAARCGVESAVARAWCGLLDDEDIAVG